MTPLKKKLFTIKYRSYKPGVTGSNPVPPTSLIPDFSITCPDFCF